MEQTKQSVENIQDNSADRFKHRDMPHRERASRYLHSILFPTMHWDQWEFHMTTRRGAHIVREIDKLEREFQDVAERAKEKPGC